MPLHKRFLIGIRHFIPIKWVISSLLNSVKIDEIRCHAILCERILSQKSPRRAFQANHGQDL